MSFFRRIIMSVGLAFFVAACSPAKPVSSNSIKLLEQNSQQIVGGERVAVEDSVARSTVALYLNLKKRDHVGMLCTGTLIGPRHVLTAAHCVADVAEERKTSISQLPDHIMIGFGNTIIERASDSRKKLVSLKNAVVYPGYQVGEIDFNFPDIAVLTLNQDAPRGFIPVPLAPARFLKRGQAITVAGYGLRDGIIGRPSRELRKVNLTLGNPRFSETQFTHRFHLTRGPCSGDSGGPVYVRTENGQLAVLGVTSWTVRGCTMKGAYTSVPVFDNWIRSVMM